MIIVIKLFLVIIFLLVFKQDYKSRLVSWILYLLIGITSFTLYLSFVPWQLVLANSVFNLCFISVLITILYLYSKLIKRQSLINNSIGIGDVFLFYSLCFLFPIMTFTLLFVFSLLFSLLLHSLLKEKYSQHNSVPLAGYIALFYSIVILFSFFVNSTFLYQY